MHMRIGDRVEFNWSIYAKIPLGSNPGGVLLYLRRDNKNLAIATFATALGVIGLGCLTTVVGSGILVEDTSRIVYNLVPYT